MRRFEKIVIRGQVAEVARLRQCFLLGWIAIQSAAVSTTCTLAFALPPEGRRWPVIIGVVVSYLIVFLGSAIYSGLRDGEQEARLRAQIRFQTQRG